MKNDFLFYLVCRVVCVLTCAVLCCMLAGIFSWAQITSFSADARFAAVSVHAGMITEAFSGAGHYMNIPIGAILIWLAWFLAITVDGLSLTVRLLPRHATTIERIVFGFGLGFIEFGLVLLGLFAFGWGTPTALSILLCFQLVTSAFALRTILRPFFNRVIHQLKGLRFFSNNWSRLGLALGLCLLVTGFLYCLTPAIQSDAMRYHLVAPQEFLKAGQIYTIPLNAFSQFPMLVQMHYGLALALNVPEVAHLMHWTCMLMCALGIGSFTYRFSALFLPNMSRRTYFAVFAFLMYLSSPAVFIVGCWPFVDQATVLFIVLSIYALLWFFTGCSMQKVTGLRSNILPLSSGDSRHVASLDLVLVAGAMAGGAIGTKYTAGPFMAIATILIFVAYYNTFRFRDLAKLMATFVGTATFAGGLWYLRNWISVGNPLYPLGPFTNTKGDWVAENSAFYAERLASKGTTKTFEHVLSSFWDSFTHGIMYEAHYPGPIFLAVILLAFAGVGLLLINSIHRHPSPTRHAMTIPMTWAKPFLLTFALGLAWWVMWFYSYQSNRLSTVTTALFIPCATLFLIMSGQFVSKSLRIAGKVATLLFICYSMAWSVTWIVGRATPGVLAYLLGKTSHTEYMTRALSYWPAFEYLNERTTDSTKVFVIGDHRLYGARFRAYWSDWFNTPAPVQFIRDNKITDADGFLQQLRKNKFTWLFINDFEMALQGASYYGRMSAAEWKIIQNLQPAAKASGYTIVTQPKALRLIELPPLDATETTATETGIGAVPHE